MDTSAVALESPKHPIGHNMQGMLDALHVMMSHVLGTSPPVSLDELYVASSFGAKHYAYDPMINLAYDPPRHLTSWSECFSNYGAFESAGFYTGFEIKEFNGLSEEDFWKLMMFELLNGRMVLSIGLHGPMTPCLVTGFDQGRTTRRLSVVPAGQTELVEVNLWGKSLAQGDHEVFQNWLVIARPGAAPPWSSPQNQRLTLLRWIVSHLQSSKEFFHETKENYHTGDRAYERMIRFFDTDLEAISRANPEQVIELAEMVERYRHAMTIGRRAMCTILPTWADDLESIERLTPTQREAMKPLLHDAAALYGEISGAFEAWSDTVPASEVLMDGHRHLAVEALSSARTLESRVMNTLAASIDGIGM